jgi:acyl-coenzyme A thioesterase PaaI-like protein
MNPAKLFATMGRTAIGRRLFTAAICRRAPYFGSMSPLITALVPGRCEVLLKKRRKVQNHIGTVHVIAVCNACEMAMGVLMESTVPAQLRWIPKGMTTRYLKKAGTDLKAVASFDPDGFPQAGGDVVVPCVVTDTNGVVVLEADITVYISPKPPKTS